MSLSLGVAAAAFAQAGGEGSHMRGGSGMMGGAGTTGGSGMMGGSEMMGGSGMMGGAGMMSEQGAQLMTAEERAALHEKMVKATPEERRKLMADNHAEMQKRAAEKGITLGQATGRHGGPGAGPCRTQGAAAQ